MIRTKIKKIINNILGYLPSSIRLKAETKFWNKAKYDLNKKRREFYLSFIPHGTVYFDVGANVGNRIEPIVFENVEIIAFEPQPYCINILKKKFGKLITLEEIALGEKEGTMQMIIASVNTVSTLSKEFMNRTRDSGRFGNVHWNSEITVQIKRLEDMVDKHGKPDFIKIDVEGFEQNVLRGLDSPVPALSFEYTLPEMKDGLVACLNEIKRIYNDNYYINYSMGEDLVLAYEQWYHCNDENMLLEDSDFLNSGFGDIYIKESI